MIQSHRRPLPGRWLEPCLASVRQWAARRGFDYRFLGDELFDSLDDELRRRIARQRVIAADIARLAVAQQGLAEGYRRVLWLDADTLVVAPEAFEPVADEYALGREVWVQRDGQRLRAYVKVHNAYLQFDRGNPFLGFYRHAAERIVRAHCGPMAPQLVGPKLLSALHNLVGCPVAEAAAMLSPAVAVDLLAGGGEALALFRSRSRRAPAALNLCGSLVGREITSDQMESVMEIVCREPDRLAPSERKS